MIMAVCSSPRNLGLDDDQAIAALCAWAACLTREEAEDYIGTFCPSGEDNLGDLYVAEKEDELEDLAEAHDDDPKLSWARRYIAEDLEESYRSALGTRSVTELSLQGLSWWVAGGMSWGDEPEGYLEISKLDHTGVFDAKRVMSVLDLSTAHAPQAGSMDRLGKWTLVDQAFPQRTQAHQYGWMIFLGDEDEDKKAADWAKPILRLARHAGCKFINFDEDAEVCEHLHDYTKGGPLEQLATTHEEHEDDE